jgi:hypothetical protein
MFKLTHSGPHTSQIIWDVLWMEKSYYALKIRKDILPVEELETMLKVHLPIH